MKIDQSKLLAVAVLAFTTLHVPVVLGQSRRSIGATSSEVVQLPKFCWEQMEVAGSIGPGYSIPRTECGVFTNHYCGGLVHLNRFKASANKSQNLSRLGLADNDIRYTERGIKDFPQCPIRDHVTASRAEVNTLMSRYGGKAPKTPAAPR